MGEHKLKKIVLQCIEDSSKDRPSAEEVFKLLHYESTKIRQKQKIAQAKVPKLEISVLGQSGAGKSSLITRFLDNKFDHGVMPTIGRDLRTINIDHLGKEYCLQIGDTAGQEKHHSIIPASIKGCQGVVLVFDLTNWRSLFEDIPEMEQLVKDHAPDSISRILVGNKADLADAEQSKRKISRKEAERFAQKCGIPYIETSAYSGKNVERAFELIAKEIYDTLDLSDIDTYISSKDNIKLTNDKSLWQKMADWFWSCFFFLETIVTNGHGNGNVKCNTATAETTVPTIQVLQLTFRTTSELTFSIICLSFADLLAENWSPFLYFQFVTKKRRKR